MEFSQRELIILTMELIGQQLDYQLQAQLGQLRMEMDILLRLPVLEQIEFFIRLMELIGLQGHQLV
jgi:hypothetical protein